MPERESGLAGSDHDDLALGSSHVQARFRPARLETLGDSLGAYTETVLTKLTVKAAPLTNRAVEYGPMVPTCCNACRTCTTTNIVGLSTAAFLSTLAVVRRLVRR